MNRIGIFLHIFVSWMWKLYVIEYRLNSTVFPFIMKKKQGVLIMKNKIITKEMFLQVCAKVAHHEAKNAANSACVAFLNQPELPKAVQKLRKF